MDSLSKLLTLSQGELFLDVLCILEGEFTIPHQPLPAGEIMFHLVLSGRCWLLPDQGQPQLLEPGSFVLLSKGQAHSISSGSIIGHEPLLIEREDEALPIKCTIDAEYGSDVDLLCGRIKYAKGAVSIFTQGLPDQICVSLQKYLGLSVLQLLTNTLRLESQQNKPGASAIINAMAQILFSYALRAYADLDNAVPSLLTLLGDDRLGKSVQAMLSSPEQPWSLHSLGQLASMSRASYARHFKDKSGTTPGEVLLAIRMMHASRLLLHSRRTLADIAETVGYQSEAAFGKAFKQLLGTNPGEWRRQQRN